MLVKRSNMEPSQVSKWAGNEYRSNVRLEVRRTEDDLEYK